VELKTLYSAGQVARRVRELGRKITRDYRGEPLELVGVLENSFIFLADLARAIHSPVRCHFIRSETRDIRDPAGYERKEIFYTPEFSAAGKHVLLVDGVLTSGVTMDFLLKRVGLSQPKSLKTAVLIDKPGDRKLSLQPDYFGFRMASNKIVVGYGLGMDGFYRNLPYIGTPAPARSRTAARKPVRRSKRRKR
jgi:hypoxanthine phosphoribosyltransferase